MSKLKNIVLITVVAVLPLFIASCCMTKVCGRGKEERTTAAPAVDYAKEGYTAATVIFYELDACKWMLQLADEKKLEPRGMDSTFQKDKLNVWVKYEVLKGAMSTCMAGPIVKVIDIKERK